MLVQVPSTYRAVFVRPKKRSQEYACLRTVVEVEIREVDAADAPVAHVLGERIEPALPESHPEHVPFAMAGGRPAEVRIIDGEFHVRRMTVEEFGEATRIEGWDNPFAGHYRDGQANVNAGPLYTFASGDRQKHSDLPQDREEFEAVQGEARKWEDRRHATVAALSGRAAHFAVVDGSVYERVSEPTLTLSLAAGRVALRITEAAPDRSRFHRGHGFYTPQSCIRFGVDEMPRALAEGERLAAEAGVPFDVLCEVEQHSPWHVRFRGEPELVTERAWGLLEALTPHVTAFSHLLGRAWHDLATALYEHRGCSLPAIDAMRRVVAMREEIEKGVARADGSFGYGAGREHDGLLWRLEGAETALHMWDTRSAEGIVWAADSLGSTATFDGTARAWEVTDLMEADAIAAAFGQDVSHMVAAAAAGRASLVAVEENRVPRLLFSLDTSDGEPRVTESVSAHGAQPARRLLDLAERHVARALENGSRPGLDSELGAFGL